jgi:Ca2+-dependent lipid-binding protein
MYNSDPPAPNLKRRAEIDQFIHENTPQTILNLIKQIKAKHVKQGEKIERIAEIVDSFAVWEHFATAGIILLTAFLTYAIAYFRMSFGWLFLALWYVSFVYSLNIKRLRQKIKNDALKEHQTGFLDSEKETIEWGNQFLSRFWNNYEPILSLSIKESVDAVLDTIKLPGVDEIRLSKFTLGSLPPRIDGIKTFTETGDEVLVIFKSKTRS